ncbi:MAG: hypothetical protein U5L04_05425 [Trueperaceae bacterium]|nr:hypothetical protein [Trueperaceae bacterium]
MQLRLDPWAAEYNTAYYADNVRDVQSDRVTTDIEYDTWQPLIPPDDALEKLDYDSLFFTDGSRRTEARVLLEDDNEQVAFGAIGTYGVGVVDCCPRGSRRAVFTDVAALTGREGVQRLCTLSHGRTLGDFELLSDFERSLGSLNYRVEPDPETDADAVLRRLQFKMLEAERNLAVQLSRNHPGALIIGDGSHPRIDKLPNVVGYVKTIHDLRIARQELDVVRRLEEGQRSPLYLIDSPDTNQRIFEFFLRLRDPRPWLYTLAGMVRIQIYAGQNPDARFDEAQKLADYLTRLLPTFASKQHQDPRAPQQLLPIRALESELRRRMGHPQIIRRRITEFLSRQGVV